MCHGHSLWRNYCMIRKKNKKNLITKLFHVSHLYRCFFILPRARAARKERKWNKYKQWCDVWTLTRINTTWIEHVRWLCCPDQEFNYISTLLSQWIWKLFLSVRRVRETEELKTQNMRSRISKSLQMKKVRRICCDVDIEFYMEGPSHFVFFHQTHNLNSWFQESVTRMNLSLIHIYIQMNLISVDGSEEKSGKEVLRKPMEVCHDIVISSTHTHIGLIRLTNKSSTRIIIIIVMECHREQCSSNE